MGALKKPWYLDSLSYETQYIWRGKKSNSLYKSIQSKLIYLTKLKQVLIWKNYLI
jgi:hypothetical protein